MKEHKAYLLFTMGLMSALAGFYMAGAFKIYGEENISNDQALSSVGAAGQV